MLLQVDTLHFQTGRTLVLRRHVGPRMTPSSATQTLRLRNRCARSYGVLRRSQVSQNLAPKGTTQEIPAKIERRWPPGGRSGGVTWSSQDAKSPAPPTENPNARSHEAKQTTLTQQTLELTLRTPGASTQTQTSRPPRARCFGARLRLPSASRQEPTARLLCAML